MTSELTCIWKLSLQCAKAFRELTSTPPPPAPPCHQRSGAVGAVAEAAVSLRVSPSRPVERPVCWRLGRSARAAWGAPGRSVGLAPLLCSLRRAASGIPNLCHRCSRGLAPSRRAEGHGLKEKPPTLKPSPNVKVLFQNQL